MGLTSKSTIQDLFVELTGNAQECLQIANDSLESLPGKTLDEIKDAKEIIEEMESIAVHIAFGGEYDG